MDPGTKSVPTSVLGLSLLGEVFPDFRTSAPVLNVVEMLSCLFVLPWFGCGRHSLYSSMASARPVTLVATERLDARASVITAT